MLRTVLCLVLLAAASAAEWHVGWSAAADAAKAAQKPILADFTGSGWCDGCVALKQQVFDTPAFAAWAAANVVLLKVDFPSTPLPQAQAAENDRLLDRYKIEGFPTILFCDAAGSEFGRLVAYDGRGAAAWIAAADAILKAKR